MESSGRAPKENILSLYHESSRLSVDTFCVSACTVCPEADVVFPCCARVCACACMHICTFLITCVTVDSKLSHQKLVGC